MEYTMIIFFYPNANNLGLGYRGITQDILGISHNVQLESFPESLPHPAFRAAAVCFLLVRVGGVAWPRLAPSCSTVIRLSSAPVTDRPPGETRLAAPKLLQLLVHLADVASPPA